MTEKRKKLLNELKPLYNTTDDEKDFIIELERACEEIPDSIIGNFQIKMIFESALYNKLEEWLNS